MARKVKNKKKKVGWKKRLRMRMEDPKTTKMLGLFIILISILLAVAFISYIYTWQIDQDKVFNYAWSALWSGDLVVHNWLGRLGAVIASLFFYWGVGLMSFLIIPVLFKLGWDLIKGNDLKPLMKMFQNVSLIVVFGSIVLAYLFHTSMFPWGGSFGQSANLWLSNFMGRIGLGLLLSFGLIGVLLWKFNPDLQQISFEIPGMGGIRLPFLDFLSFRSAPKESAISNPNPESEITLEPGEAPPLHVDAPFENTKTEIPIDLEIELPKQEKTDAPGGDLQMEIIPPKPEEEATVNQPTVILEQSEGTGEQDSRSDDVAPVQLEPYDPTLDLSDYKSPELPLLRDYEHKGMINSDELEANKNRIIETLGNYGIKITKIRATIGPTVTLYEIVPAKGVRISKIRGLVDDIALNLSALGIRIIAPIPGRGTIGIEVPNKNPQIVSLKEVLCSPKFTEAKMELPIALGKTISNEVFVADLAKMPHLLVAGATGQGKSVGINTILMSLVYKKHPSEVKLVLIDPKKVELPIYNDLEKHFLAFLPDAEEAIITETDKVIYTLNSLVIEMESRYDLLKKARVRNIKEYNEKFKQRQLNPENGHKFLPFIVLVIDEFADLIMTAGKEIEMPIGRLAQLARAVGIHLIIATQRPSVKIITGLIKANFPARIAFRVTSQIDSRTILDQGGAEQLVGRGDMLLTLGGDLIRLQCAFVDTPEIEEVASYIGKQRGYVEPYLLPEYKTEEDDIAGKEIKVSELDAMFKEAARLVVQQQHGSTSMIQRRLKLGYNRAGRIMDQLETLGIVGPAEGSKPREVYVFSVEELERIFENIFDKD